MKKICFGLLVHEKQDVIQDQIDNIKFFCPNSSIVIFQSGTDPVLCDRLSYPVCPTSFPLQWGKTLIWYYLNVMEWIEDIGYEYDYFINIDSDALFAKKGFEELINFEMKDADYMAAHFNVPSDNWDPGRSMKRVWNLWQPIFKLDHFYKCFGAQVFSRNFVKQILSFNKLADMKRNIKQTENDVFALEEILFPTLAISFGIKTKPYPNQMDKWLRYRPHFSENELINAIKNNEDCYIIHPVYRDMNDKTRTFIRSLIDIQTS